ncbi:MAG TPA: sigma-70 family RNA polymerase sigma factor [Ramlibacter sp.]|nr:sigma-70 family RNA polymerase sigma factor [Ramlibacter sp.]
MEALNDAGEAGLWQRLRTSGDEAARAALLERHLGYARTVAAVYYGKRWHDEVEFGDYLQMATIGLLEAMDRFEPGRGAQFRTFAARRMHGAILDGLERLTEKQQQVAALQRLRSQRLAAVREMAQERAADAAGQAEQLLRFVSEAGLGLAIAWMLEGTGMVDDPHSAETIPFYRSAELRQLRERLHVLVEGLPAQQRTVIRYHYLQGMPFDRIADMLRLTKGRISQVHKQALLALRVAFTAAAQLDTRL